MGGALAVTPATAVNPASVTIRLKTIPTNDQLAPLTNSLKILEKTYTSPCENGLAKIKVTDLDAINVSSDESLLKAKMEDTLFLCGYVLTEDNTPNWNGFMEMSTRQEKDYQVSKVLIQPFLNLQASSLNAIYSWRMLQQKLVRLVMFDRPLYRKAVKMVSSGTPDGELSSIVVRSSSDVFHGSCWNYYGWQWIERSMVYHLCERINN